VQRHVAALEADAGAGRPLGFTVAGGNPAVALVRKLVEPLTGLHLADVTGTDEAGADLIPLQVGGVPVLGLNQDMSSYFDWHHTAADTLDKIDPTDLSLDVAAFAWVVHALADGSERLPAPPPPPRW
jgi:Zn-dependent M28 family amino/carboxypeptidase